MADTVKGVEIDPVREKLVELQLKADIEDETSENTTQHREYTADLMIANGVTVQEWISVKDRLPEPGVRVLASDEEFVGEFYINKRGQWQRYNVNDVALLMALDILWWKPLPQPPKSENTSNPKSGDAHKN